MKSLQCVELVFFVNKKLLNAQVSCEVIYFGGQRGSSKLGETHLQIIYPSPPKKSHKSKEIHFSKAHHVLVSTFEFWGGVIAAKHGTLVLKMVNISIYFLPFAQLHTDRVKGLSNHSPISRVGSPCLCAAKFGNPSVTFFKLVLRDVSLVYEKQLL